MSKKPMTQREIKKGKKKEKAEMLTVYNPRGQAVPLQIRDPEKDFYVSEQTIHLGPGKRYTDYAHMFNRDQIENLSTKGMIRVL
jgi:hypothetical protein